MKKTSIQTLNQLNKTFYETVAQSFDNSRSYLWDGWDQLAPIIDLLLDKKKHISVLDVGCGNGRFISWIDAYISKKAFPTSNQVSLHYTGIDSNDFLLQTAQQNAKTVINNISAEFKNIDIVNHFPTTFNDETFDLIVCFGVIHHIPGSETRREFIRSITQLLTPNGFACIAAWDFTSIPSLMNRSQKLSDTHIIPDPEENDYLLDWKRNEHAYRYCHHVTNHEMQDLWSGTQTKIVLHYRADGPTKSSNVYWVVQKNRYVIP